MKTIQHQEVDSDSLTSFIPSTVSLWNNLDLKVRISPNISCFKSRIKSPGYYGEGSIKLSILHARLRHQCSSLNSDLYRINITNDPKCQCGAPYEDSIHYLLMECPLYQNERYCLFRNLRETNKNIETLLFGNDEISINENSNIFNKFEHILDKQKDSNQWSVIWSTSTSIHFPCFTILC